MEKNAAVIEKVAFTFPVQVLKTAEADGEFHVVGYAATTDFDLQGDIITEEALKAASLDLLKNSTVLLNHDLKLPIGRVTKVEFDSHGLLIDVLVSKTEPDVIQKIKEGVLNKFSIRGQVLERERKFDAELDRTVNVIKRMSLVEVSLVSVPANPEARAIGWYVSKALEESDRKSEGGNAMPEEQVVIEEISPETGQPAVPAGGAPPPGGPAPSPAPAAAKPEAAKPEAAAPAPAQGEPKPEEKPKAEATDAFAQAQAQKPTEIQKIDLRGQLEPVFFLLDKLIAMGGQAGPIAQQVKAMLKHMAGDTAYPYPSVYPYPKAVSKDELGKMIAGEVQKQVETALKAVPTLRKGLIEPEGGAEDVKKQFESLPPDKKLRAALALQQPK